MPVISSLTENLLEGRDHHHNHSPGSGVWAPWALMYRDMDWSSDLQALSCTCKFMRDELWAGKMRFIKIRVGDVARILKLEEAVPIKWREFIQSVFFRNF